MTVRVLQDDRTSDTVAMTVCARFESHQRLPCPFDVGPIAWGRMDGEDDDHLQARVIARMSAMAQTRLADLAPTDPGPLVGQDLSSDPSLPGSVVSTPPTKGSV